MKTQISGWILVYTTLALAMCQNVYADVRDCEIGDLPEQIYINVCNTAELATMPQPLIDLHDSLTSGGYRGIVEQHPFRKLRVGMTVNAVDGDLLPEECPTCGEHACSSSEYDEHACDFNDVAEFGYFEFNPFKPQIWSNPYLFAFNVTDDLGYPVTSGGRFKCLTQTFSQLVPLQPAPWELAGHHEMAFYQALPNLYNHCLMEQILAYGAETNTMIPARNLVYFMAPWMYGSLPSGCDSVTCPSLSGYKCIFQTHVNTILDHYAGGEFWSQIPYWGVTGEVVRDDTPSGTDLEDYINSYTSLTNLAFSHFTDPGNDVRDLYMEAWAAAGGEGNAIDGFGDGPNLILYEHGAEMATMTFDSTTITNQKFESVLHVAEVLKYGDMSNARVPLAGVALEGHLPAFAFFVPNEASGHEGELRLSREQLMGIHESIRQFSEIGKVLITEFELRMGIPVAPDECFSTATCPDSEPDPDCADDATGANSEWTLMMNTSGRCWQSYSYEQREAYQAEAYEALLNAILSNQQVEEITFWQPFDYDNWYTLPTTPDYDEIMPFTPRYDIDVDGDLVDFHLTGDLSGYRPEGAADPGLFTYYPLDATDLCEIVSWYAPKSSYFAVENALKTFFGPAMIFATPEQEEVVRFAENGNVVLFKGDIVTDMDSDCLDEFPDSGPIFKVKTGSPQITVAVIDANSGNLYLKGQAYDHASVPLVESEPATPGDIGGLQVRSTSEYPALPLKIWIDPEGNLNAVGDIIVHGIAMDVAPVSSPAHYVNAAT